MNNYTVIASEEFEVMLNQNLSYIQILSSQYVNYITSIISNVSSILKNFPFAFPRFLLPNDTSRIRKITIAKRYYLIYQVTDNVVEILYFVDGRRSYDNMFTY